ncbi:MAG: hypothetical protein ACI87W_000232 [Halieaceae bacterium]|jgi:hypothetical protein
MAVIATVSYCLAAWCISGLWSTLVSDPVNVPVLAALTVRPLPLSMEYAMLHWQLLALLSLLGNGYWSVRRSSKMGEDGYVLPLLCHYGWLFSALCLHLAGALVGFVSVVYKL